MKSILLGALLMLSFITCQKEEITIGTEVSETFYVENEGASMRVLVEGNTASKTILLFVHGGPGTGSFFYNTQYISDNIEDKYAVAYWDQRNAGASQGNSNGEHLNLLAMTEDLKKVIQVLKHRYGNDTKVFLLAHSFGGILTTSFLTLENNQDLVDGWIVCSASHNYPLNDRLSKEALLYHADREITRGNHVNNWTEIKNFCLNLPEETLSLSQANQLNTYCTDAEDYFSEVVPFSLMDILKENAIEQDYPITSIFFNHGYSQNAEINNELRKYNFSDALRNVTIPVLTLYGKYDFVCPPALGESILMNVSSTQTSSFLLPNSGHNGMFQDEYLFCEKVNEFINRHR